MCAEGAAFPFNWVRGKKDISWADTISSQSPQPRTERMALLGDSLEPPLGLGN